MKVCHYFFSFFFFEDKNFLSIDFFLILLDYCLIMKPLNCIWIFLCLISDGSPETLEAHKIKTAFFTYPTLMEICRRLVTHYFLLTDEELMMWEEDPESFGKMCGIVGCSLFRYRYKSFRPALPLQIAYCNIGCFIFCSLVT